MTTQSDLTSFADESTAVKNTAIDLNRELTLLEQIEYNPDVNQATLAAQLGVAVGTVNWHLKRLVAKGYVKVKRAQRHKLRYIITPEGIALRAHLTVHYIETSMNLYRRTRNRVRELLVQVKQAGHNHVYIDGEGDIADICRLTCLEHGIMVLENTETANSSPEPASMEQIPCLEVCGARVSLKI
jgi:DNA-binding MarR family transcriptional regulator